MTLIEINTLVKTTINIWKKRTFKVEKEKRHSSRSKEKRKKESENKARIIKQTVDSKEQRDYTGEGHLEDIEPETSPMKVESLIRTDHELSGLKFIISIISFHQIFMTILLFMKTTIAYSSEWN